MAHREGATAGHPAGSAAGSAAGSGAGHRANPGARSGGILLAGTLASNLLSYAFFVVLSRSLGAGDLGAVGSLVNLATLAAVPALGLQLVAARLVSRSVGSGRHPGLERSLLGWALLLGLAGWVLTALASPALAALLHLTVLDVVVLGAAVVPTTVVLAAQGVLQGAERFARLSVVLALSGLAKFGAAAGATVTGGGVTRVVVLLTLGWLVVAGLALALLPLRGVSRDDDADARNGVQHLPALVAAAVVPTSGLLLLSSLDVLLARHHLPSAASGAYTVAALFEKAAFWGLSFLATLFYPAMAQPLRRRAALVRALVVTAGAGAVGVGLTVAFGPWLVGVVGGAPYAGLGGLLWRFTALGVGLALVQVLAYAGLAAARTAMGVAMWVAAIAAVALAGWRHDDVDAVVGVMLVAVSALVVVGLLIERDSLARPGGVSARRRARSARPRR